MVDDYNEYVEVGREVVQLNKVESVTGTGGFYPEGSQRLLTTGYLRNCSPEVLRLIRNDIFARHGHRFKDPELRALFESAALRSQFSDDGKETPLTETERLNVELLKQYENQR